MSLASRREYTSLQHLREATGREHERVEQVVEERFFEPSGVDPARFRDLLRSFLGLYRPLDRRLLHAVDRHLPSYPYRPRSRRLEGDLAALGCTSAEIEELPTASLADVVPLDTVPRLLGCLYVVEGAELGGRVIWKRLQRELGDEELAADAFFGTDADRTRLRWNRFRDTFDRHVTERGSLDTATVAARDTFRTFREWMS